jgi:hypothetical protein
MIATALILLREELNEYIRSLPGNTNLNYVVLGNASEIDSTNNGQLLDTLIISLVNIEEESTLKNINVMKKLANGTVRYENPPVFLNLYVLFTANFPDKYENALVQISQTIRFFQSKNFFNLSNTISPTTLAKANDPTDPEKDTISGMELNLDMYTMTFEQINHLWGSLGGKQIPFVMYKTRLIVIREPKYMKEGPVIEEIDQNIHPFTENN